jgi:hypothetical protein
MSSPSELVDQLLSEQSDPIRPGRDVYVWTKFFEDGERSFWQVYVGIPALEAPHRTFNARRLNSAIQSLVSGEEVKVWDRNFGGAQKSLGGLRINVVSGPMGARQDDGGDQALLQKVTGAITQAGYKVSQR